MTEHLDSIVIGAGQAGLATGYYLRKRDRDFVILDAGERVGDPWRHRWDSLHLHTPARYDGLPGLSFPAPPHAFPTKDEMADYLELYAERFDLPVRANSRVDRLSCDDERFLVTAEGRRFQSDNVVVAMGSYQVPKVPSFAGELDDDIVQLHTRDYQNPAQLQDGGVLVVGAGNSGAEISLDVVDDHETWLSGRDVGHVPFRIESRIGRYLGVPFVLRVLFHRILTTGTPIGRKQRPELLSKGGPLVRVKPRDLTAAGVERVPRTVGIRDGQPVVDDDRVLDVENVVWCTGFRPDFSWIDLPVFNGEPEPKEPTHVRGVVSDQPGLYFVGLFFLYALSSSLVSGVGRDAGYDVEHLVSRPS